MSETGNVGVFLGRDVGNRTSVPKLFSRRWRAGAVTLAGAAAPLTGLEVTQDLFGQPFQQAAVDPARGLSGARAAVESRSMRARTSRCRSGATPPGGGR